MNSMTAFYLKSFSFEWGVLQWEIRSVNHRYLELSFKLPDSARSLEPKIREQVKNQISRGKVDIQLQIKRLEDEQSLAINTTLLNNLQRTIEQIQNALPEAVHINPVELLKWPGLVETAQEAQTFKEDLLTSLQRSLDEIETIRQREGNALTNILMDKVKAMRKQVALAKTLLPSIRQHFSDQLRQRIIEHTDTLDESRFHQEIVIQAQKMDVTEELDRLETHLDETERLFSQQDRVGRRLDFLMQELNREANTLGSKSIDSRTAKISIELKVLIEQMREQIQNIE